MTDDDELRGEARKRLQKRRDFGAHIVAYMLVNVLLIAIWAVSGGGYFWPIWVILGWGLGLAFNAWDVFYRRGVTDADIDREVRKMRGEDS